MLMGSYRVHFHMSPMPELAYLQHQENKILVRRRAGSAVARGVSRVWCVSLSGQAALFRNDRSTCHACRHRSVISAAPGPGPGARLGSLGSCLVLVVCPGRLWGCFRPRGEKLAHHHVHDHLYGSIYRARAKARRGVRRERRGRQVRPRRDGAEIGAPVLGGVLEPRGGLARCVEQHRSCACCCTAQSQPAKRHARAPLQLMYHMTDFVSQHTGRYRIPNETDKPACEGKKHVWYMSPHMSSRYLELRDSRGAVRLQTPYGKPTHVYRPIPHRGSSRNSRRVLSPIASSQGRPGVHQNGF